MAYFDAKSTCINSVSMAFYNIILLGTIFNQNLWGASCENFYRRQCAYQADADHKRLSFVHEFGLAFDLGCGLCRILDVVYGFRVGSRDYVFLVPLRS
jgi:hypothetical protein